MVALVYLSEATTNFDAAAIADLAAKAAEKNARLQVTGYLHFRAERGVFFQYLEGPHEAVLELMEAISHDPRHRIVNLVHLGDMPARLFPNWSMRHLSANYFHMIQMEDVLEGVLLTMRGDVFDRATVVETVLRLTRHIASRRLI